MKKRILAILLSLGLVAAGLPAEALAAGTDQEVSEAVQEGYEDLSDAIIQEGGFLPETEERAGSAALESGKREQAQKAIMEAWDSFASSCDLSAYQIPVENFKEIYVETLNKNPRYFYVSGQWSYYLDGNIVTKVIMTYSMNQSEAKSMRDAYDQAVAQAVSGAQASWSDMEKALYINDYLARNCEYDVSLQKHTAYDALVGRTAVCQGYALAFLELARQLGLSCEMVTSESLNHAWNMVKLGGSYYNVDVTWNDPVNDCLGRACHTYFMKSTAFFKTGAGVEPHLGSVDDWVVSGGIPDTVASDAKYDNYFWNQTNVGFDYINGSWYGFDGNDSICRYSCNGTDFTSLGAVQRITDVWTVIGSGGSYWQGKYVGTGSLNGKYYYSGRDSIYELDAATGKNTLVFTLSDAQKQRGYIYGMNVSASGELQYILAESPNDEGTVLTAMELERPHTHTEETRNAAEATCQWEGYTGDVYCRECGALLREGSVIEKKAHTSAFDEAIPATCTEEGKTEGEHCKECGETLQEAEIIPALGHDWEEDYTVDKPATAEEEGERSIHCSRCPERKDIESIPKIEQGHVHTIVTEPAIEATCTEEGKTEGKYCKECGETLQEAEIIPALGHDWEEDYTVDKPATAEEEGEKSIHCSRCPERKDVESIPKIEQGHVHTIVTEPAIEATCTEEGKTEGKYCKECGETLQEAEIIPALGHDWEENYTVDKPATAEEEGERSIHCSRCPERKDVESIPRPEPGETEEIALSSCEIALESEHYTYDGRPKEPVVTVRYKGAVLTPSKDYQAEYSDNVHAGTAFVIISGKGICTGSVTKTFRIQKAANQIRVAGNYNKTSKKGAQTFKLDIRATGGTIAYQSQNKSVKVAKDGRVTIPKNFVGKAVIQVTAGNGDYATVTKKITVTVNPAGVSLTQARNASGRKLELKWKKNAQASGYQIQYSASKKFSGAKSKLISGASKTKYTLSGLKKKKTYYVRIRAYKTVGKVRYYSAWSGAKKCVIQK